MGSNEIHFLFQVSFASLDGLEVLLLDIVIC